MYHETGKATLDESTAGKKARRRNEKKEANRRARNAERLGLALSPVFVRFTQVRHTRPLA
jgi:hypothetical protein